MPYFGGKFYGSRRDANHRSVELWFRRQGCDTADLSSVGGGVPDLVVGCDGENYMVEIKNPLTRYGKKGLNETQSTWAKKWRGGIVESVATEQDVERLVASWREKRTRTTTSPQPSESGSVARRSSRPSLATTLTSLRSARVADLPPRPLVKVARPKPHGWRARRRTTR